jgi:hypothetical protein
MALFSWSTGDRITATRLNTVYNLFKGVSGGEDTIRLAHNVENTLQLRPTSDPASDVALFTVDLADGTARLGIWSHGGVSIGNQVDPGATNLTVVGTSIFTGAVTFSGDITVGDDDDIVWGAGSDVQMRWSLGDTSNHAFVIALSNTNQAIHITDVGAQATDWNLAAVTDPNVYIHSNTTPATDYLRLGGHDGTLAYIDVVGGTTLHFQIAGNTEVSITASGLTLPAGSDLLFTGTTGTNDINLVDSVADALSIVRGSTDMVVFDSNTPLITITPALTVTGIVTAATGSVFGTLTIGDGSIVDSSGAIAFGNENLSTTGTLSAAATTITGTLDAESYAAIGNGSGVNAGVTLRIDRDFSVTADGWGLRLDGVITVTDGTNNIEHVGIFPSGVVINSGGTHSEVGSVRINEPIITETSGSVTTAYTLKITSAPTEGTNNYALWVDAGATQLDGTLTVGGVLSSDDTTNATSATTGAIHTDGGLGIAKRLWVGTFATINQYLVIDGTDTNYLLRTNTSESGSTGCRWHARHNSTSPADSDLPWELTVNANDSGGTSREMVRIFARWQDVTSTTMDSDIAFRVMDNVNAGIDNVEARLSPTGVWTDASAAADKAYEGTPDEIWPDFLDRLATLNVSRYHSVRAPKKKESKERHVSPTAEDFYAAFGVGADPATISPGIAAKDLAGISMIGVQKLYAELEAAKARIEVLEAA